MCDGTILSGTAADLRAENEHLRRILSDMLAAYYAGDEDRARALRAVAREAVGPHL